MVHNDNLANYALDDIIKVDYYRLKVLKHLGKLIEEEYRLANIQLASQYSLMYLKLYKRVVREYKGTIYLDTTATQQSTEDHTSLKETKYISTKYLDRVIDIYMGCRGLLVGQLGKRIIEDINQSLPETEQWEVFTKYSDIYVADGNTWGDSKYRQTLINRYNKTLQKLRNQYRAIGQAKTLVQYARFLKTIDI